MLTTFVVHVDDKVGVLNRVVSLFRQRGFNIESLTVGHSETPGTSRMTIVVHADAAQARRLEAHVHKLVNVLNVENVSSWPSVLCELAMIKVAATHELRTDVMRLVDALRARTVDVAPDSLVIEVTGSEDRIDGLVKVLAPYGVIELVRTGRVVMTRGAHAVREALPPPADGEDDDSISYPNEVSRMV